MSNKFAIGLDVGYGAVKAYASDGRSVSFPSLTAKVEVAQREDGPKNLVRDRTGVYMVGEDALLFGKASTARVSDSWVHDDQYRILSIHAMNLFGTKDAELVVGLPATTYKRHNGNLANVYESFMSMGYRLNVKKVLPQPMGTLLDVAMDEETGNPREGFAGKVGVVDIGAGTVDCIEANSLRLSWAQRSSENRGMHRAHEALYAHILDKLKIQCSLADMPKVMRDGYINRQGKAVDLATAIDAAKRSVLVMVKVQMENLWGNLAQLDRIIFSGGGAEAMRKQILATFPTEQVVIPEDPAMSNARGFLKMHRMTAEA